MHNVSACSVSSSKHHKDALSPLIMIYLTAYLLPNTGNIMETRDFTMLQFQQGKERRKKEYQTTFNQVTK